MTVPRIVATASRVFVAVSFVSVPLIAAPPSPSVPSLLLSRTPPQHVVKPVSPLLEFTTSTFSTNICSDRLLCDPFTTEVLGHSILPSVEYSHSLPTPSPPSSQFLDTQQFEQQEYTQFDFSECNATEFFYSPDTFSEHSSPFDISAPSFTPFLDQIISEVRDEIESEKQIFTSPVPVPSSPHPVTPPSTFHSSSAAQSGEIVQCQGKQYRIIIEPVNEESSADETGRVSPVPKAPVNELKRKHSSPSECENDSLTYEPQPKKKPISLALLSPVEVAQRKKEQNRMAALKYREKQRNAKKNEKSEMSLLTERNSYLRAESDRLECEVKKMKSFLFHRFRLAQ